MTSLFSDSFRLPGAILDQRFRLGEAIGEGPIHVVYHGHDILENCSVCLKIPKLRFRFNQGFAMRYRRDLLDVMLLSDPSWVTPSMLAEHEGVPIQVLPFLQADTLPDWFEKTGRDEKRLIQVLSLALKSLLRLHRRAGRIHGSIKPSNIFVNQQDEPLFTDLAATGRLEDHFAEKAKSGEPVYWSPEQLSGERAGPASDIYSLGLVLYLCLARRHPYYESSANTAHLPANPERLLTSLLEQLHNRPKPPSNFSEDVPRWADRFIGRCLHPHPDERFTDAQEAIDWLKNHTNREPALSAAQRTLPPVGRESEMEYLLAQLEQIVKTDLGGAIIRLQGALGCGKTRCLSWLVEHAQKRQVKSVIVEPTPESGLHLQSLLSELCLEYPQLIDNHGPVVESLLTVVVDEPLLLVVRDIQKADDTLVGFFQELQEVLGDIPLLLLLVDENGAFRSKEMEAFISGLGHTLSLKPLDQRAIANLIEERAWTRPTASVARWVHSVSAGNALHATLLLEYLQTNDDLSDTFELDWRTSPPNERPTLTELVKRRLATLSGVARSLLEAAAVLGHPFRLSTLNAITYRSEEEVDESLGEGVAKGLLDLTAPLGATAYSWKHPVFRSTLLAALQPRRKQRIHRLAAAFYSRGEPEPAKMAYHFLRAGDTPELFYWGALAAERAFQLRRRGEYSFWLNTLLSRVPEQEWFGPEIGPARAHVSRDQAESLNLEEWTTWLKSLSGREDADRTDDPPLLKAQRALSSNQDWRGWQERVTAFLPELARTYQSESKSRRALVLLKQEWKIRSTNGEPFPKFED